MMSSSPDNSVSESATEPGKSSRAVSRQRGPGFHSTAITDGGVRELHLSFLPLPGEDLGGMLKRLQRTLQNEEARIAKLDCFGPNALFKEALPQMERVLGKPAWPITWTDGQGCADHQIGGMQAIAISGAALETVRLHGRVIGSVYQDTYARHYLLGDLRPTDLSAPKSVQTSQTYEQLETALDLKGMSMLNVVRTWFWLDDILSWYDDFNRVRNSFYMERKLIERLVPASTGVGIKNPYGTALVLGAWALEPLNGALTMGMLPSPLQCPAPSYGSCFSRAMEIVTPVCRRVFVSGTASIEADGTSAHYGDMARQVDLTMRVIEAILATRTLNYSQTSRATGFIKSPPDSAVFGKWSKGRKPALPVAVVQADICRDELLFELELDAIAAV